MAAAPTRIDGYAPISDYAVIGNKRTAALIARDGSIDFLCLPSFDSPSVLAALLDPHRGGRLSLAPEEPYTVERRYVPDTNVLETTFVTAQGRARVTDAMTLRPVGPLPWHELVRRVEGLSGRVPMRWRFEPRFAWGAERGEWTRRQDVPVVDHDGHTVVLRAWDAGEPAVEQGDLTGRFEVAEGGEGLLALNSFQGEPLRMSSRTEVEQRLDETIEYWPRWLARCTYDGDYGDVVRRSALALDLLVFSPTGAIVAAPTTSLPERIGGERNWDYRFSWVRDSAFTLEAMLQLGFGDQVHASLAFMLEATKRTHPRLGVFYHLDGEPPGGAQEVDLDGYRGSRPVLIGNGAAGQLQLGNWGDLFETVCLYVADGNALDDESAHRLPELADFLCHVWRDADASIWELGDSEQYFQGKLSAWVAFDRAARLSRAGHLAGDGAARWEREARQVRDYIERECWSSERGAYMRYAGSDGLDASALLASRVGFHPGDDPRLQGTIEAIRRDLGRGPLLYRYSGMQEKEGAFLTCSFWLVEALARAGRRDEARTLMDELVGLVNDVGLLSEQIDPDTGTFLGNFPQALTHLALVNAAAYLAKGG